jgi:hypothetical protein
MLLVVFLILYGIEYLVGTRGCVAGIFALLRGRRETTMRFEMKEMLCF